jgi:hypothetical protein
MIPNMIGFSKPFYLLRRSLVILCFFFMQHLAAQPVIKSFSPASGPIGSLVTITGENFDATAANNIVYFGGVRANVSSASPNRLEVIAPAGTTYKPISVTTAGLTGYSVLPFLVTVQGGDILNADSFAPKKDSALDFGSGEPIIADFDGDGKADILINRYSNISILRNTSAGRQINFAPPINIGAIGSSPQMAIGDLDGDGKLDMVMMIYTFGQFIVYRNNSTAGNIAFTRVPGAFNIGSKPLHIAIQDVDGDGRPDVVSENNLFQYNVSFFRNTTAAGVISFAGKIDYTIGIASGGGSFYLSDLNLDGLPELAVSEQTTNAISIRRNTSTPGTISFGATTPISSPGSLAFGDIDGDSKPDLIKNPGGSVSVFRNISSGGSIAFASPVSVGGGQQATSIGDINADGKPDILTVDTDNDKVSVIINKSSQGRISFGEQFDYITGDEPYYIAVGDLNNDGKPDIVTDNLSRTFSVLRNKVADPVIIPSGTQQVSGEIFISVTVDNTVNAVNAKPYLQRHYDIEPEIDPSKATATLTLYFTQQDFDNFNLQVQAGNKLPTGASDVFGKQNIRVFQYHGTSSTGIPGTYSGAGIEIDPDDDKIVWNESKKIWEVTFDVTGFSGFFLGSAGTSIVPLRLIAFEAEQSGLYPVLNWLTSKEENTKIFELQRSINGSNFSSITTVTAAGNSSVNKRYTYTDTLSTAAVYYYRLKMIDIDNQCTYSKVVSVSIKALKALFTLFPNPADAFVIAKHPSSTNNADIKLIDLAGRVIQTIPVKRNAVQTDIDLRSVMKGTYKLVWSDGERSETQTLFLN